MPSVHLEALEKTGTRTPKTISAEIVALCRGISSDHEARYVEVHPAPGARIGECFHNVAEAVEQAGGRLLYGWAIWEWPRVFVEAEHHAVWEVDGQLVDVTPAVPSEERIVFLPDPARAYDWEGRKRLLNIKRPTGGFDSIHAWLRASERFQKYAEGCSTGGVATMDRRVMASLLDEARQCRGMVLVDLARTTARNEPCFCQSGRKFKQCCSPLIRP